MICSIAGDNSIAGAKGLNIAIIVHGSAAADDIVDLFLPVMAVAPMEEPGSRVTRANKRHFQLVHPG